MTTVWLGLGTKTMWLGLGTETTWLGLGKYCCLCNFIPVHTLHYVHDATLQG